jgi:8-oxo-dGTP diphosphatase
MLRVRAIIVEADNVALIERRRAERHYLVFPGGKVEPGETARQALIREVREELGVEVEVGREVAEVVFPDRLHRFFLATIAGGRFGSGQGPEVTGRLAPERGTYRPLWLPVADLARQPVVPREIAALVVAAVRAGWPSPAVRIAGTTRWWA